MIQIKHRWTNAVLYELEVETLREAVIKAVKSGANLSDANLRDADLSGADLRGADLRDVNLRDADLRDADLLAFKTDLFDVLLRAPNEVPLSLFLKSPLSLSLPERTPNVLPSGFLNTGLSDELNEELLLLNVGLPEAPSSLRLNPSGPDLNLLGRSSPPVELL